MYACDAGNDKIVELLLDHDANPNTQNGQFPFPEFHSHTVCNKNSFGLGLGGLG